MARQSLAGHALCKTANAAVSFPILSAMSDWRPTTAVMAGMHNALGARYQVHGADGQLSAVIYANWCLRQRTSEGISLSRSISLHSAGCGPTSFTKSASAYGSKSLSFTGSWRSKLAACLRGYGHCRRSL